jgi:hypothetical protein
MPRSEAESGYGIKIDATKEKVSRDPYIFRFLVTYHLRGFFKNLSAALYFSPSHDLPLEGDFKNVSGAPIKTGLLIPYLVRGSTNFLPEDLIFPPSRDLPLEGDFKKLWEHP